MNNKFRRNSEWSFSIVEYMILTKISNRNVFKSEILNKSEMFPSDPLGSLDDFSFEVFVYLGGVSYE